MKYKKKLLFRIGSLRAGGAERAIVNLLKKIDYQKNEIDLLLNIKSGELLCEVPDEVNLFYINDQKYSKSFFLLSIVEKILNLLRLNIYRSFPKILYSRILKSKSYDVEISFNQNGLFDLLKSPNKDSVKVVWMHSDPYRAGLMNRSYLESLDKINIIVCVSNGIKESIIKNHSHLAHKIEVLYNILEIEKIRSDAQVKIKCEFENKSIPIFCTVGSLIKVKGIDRLIKAQANLHKKGAIFNLLIIGEGSERKALEELVKENQLSQYVKFLGYKKNPYQFVKGTDALIHPSHYEGFGNVLIEAIALGIPVIATDFISAKEIIGENRFGIVVENTLEGIEKGVDIFLDERKRKKIKENIVHDFHYEIDLNKLYKIISG